MSVPSTVRIAKPTDPKTLAKSLRLHKRIQPVFTLLDRSDWIFPVAGLCAGIPLFWLDRHSQSLQSLWPVLGVGAYILLTFCLVALESLWKSNIDEIAASNNVAAVAPLVDFAGSTFLSVHTKSGKMPSSEAVVLKYLPKLLARMPAGDGPELTPRQRATLARLIYNPKYTKDFNLPGLREKIEAMVQR